MMGINTITTIKKKKKTARLERIKVTRSRSLVFLNENRQCSRRNGVKFVRANSPNRFTWRLLRPCLPGGDMSLLIPLLITICYVQGALRNFEVFTSRLFPFRVLEFVRDDRDYPDVVLFVRNCEIDRTPNRRRDRSDSVITRKRKERINIKPCDVTTIIDFRNTGNNPRRHEGRGISVVEQK